MKNLLIFIGLIFLKSYSYAQAPEYNDLRILYADRNYEKLVREAEKYTTNDKTKKDALPYIWCAKGLYKIHLSGSSDEKFKNAYKDAISFLSKGMKFDMKYNDGATVAEESEFIGEFQASVYESILNDVSTGNYKKASGMALRYQKITTNEVGALYLIGACKYNDNDKQGARESWTAAEGKLKEITSLDDWSEADVNMLKIGVLHSAAALKKSRQEAKAQELVGKVAQWFENDEDWQALYDEIVNKV